MQFKRGALRAKRYIYIMANLCLQNMVKIGYATEVEERRKQLSTTALPYEYEVYTSRWIGWTRYSAVPTVPENAWLYGTALTGWQSYF